MKNYALILCTIGLLCFASCQNTSKKSNTKEFSHQSMNYDSLPEAEWNGEYLEIKREENNRPQPQKLGSTYLHLGQVSLQLGEKEIKFTLFKGKGNLLNFTDNTITAFIQGDSNQKIQIHFKKSNIVSNYKGKYKPVAKGKNIEGVEFTIYPGGNSNIEEYQLVSGRIQLIEFIPNTGKLELKVEGVFANNAGKTISGSGKIDMTFDQTIRLQESI